MTVFDFPWLESAIAVPILGAPIAAVLHDRGGALRWTLFFSGVAFVCAFMAWLGFWLGESPGGGAFTLDELNAPLVPVVALMHLLTALTTTRSRQRFFSFGWLLAGDGIRLAIFGCVDPLILVALLALGTLPPFAELVQRGKPVRVYAIHMTLFVVLLFSGWAVSSSLLLLLAILVRCGVVPAHCWVADLFEHASFGTALMFVAPLVGFYAAVRLVLPVAPVELLQSVGAIAVLSAVYAAGMATVQTEARRMFAYLFLSHSALVLVGLELVGLEHHATLCLTGSLCLWFSVIVSLTGFGLALRAVESRFGRLPLTDYHGLYDHSPALAVAFLLTGLASVGFPGTVGFVSAELMVDGAVEANLAVGLAVVVAGALNGIAVMRAYFLLFTGARRSGTIPLGVTVRERIALLTLVFLILGGGLVPQPGVSSRHRAAEAIIQARPTPAGAETPAD